MNKKELNRINLILNDKDNPPNIKFSIQEEGFKNLINLVKALISECHIIFNKKDKDKNKEKEIKLIQIDDGRICLINLTINNADLINYSLNDNYKIGINVDNFAEILNNFSITKKPRGKKAKANFSEPLITFYYYNVPEHKIILEKSEFEKAEMKPIDLGDSGIKPEALDAITYESSFIIEPIEFKRNISYSEEFSETTLISNNIDNITLKSEGYTGGHISKYEDFYKVKLEQKIVTEIKNRNDRIQEGTYANQYLLNMTKDIEKLTSELKFELNNNTPTKISVNLFEESKLIYYLAPRVDEVEEDYDDSQLITNMKNLNFIMDSFQKIKSQILEIGCSESSEQLLMEQAKKGKLEFAIREHNAEKKGLHLDLVIGIPESECIADFVIPKTDLSDKRLAIEQNPHPTKEFLLDKIGVSHVIKEGYGKGTWKTIEKGIAEQVDGKHSFKLKSSENNYDFYRFRPNNWFIIKQKK